MNRFKLGRDIKLGIKNLLMNKLRSLLTVLGIVFGVGSVIAMLSVGEGASREAIEQIRKLVRLAVRFACVLLHVTLRGSCRCAHLLRCS